MACPRSSRSLGLGPARLAYRLSRRARDDLVDIYIEGVRAFGRQQAERYHAGLEEVFGFLEAFPRAAPERSGITPPVRVHS
ncbi:type II toxin-antitoxin system RelE/ParE family toxin [Caulobacter radicis]|uniref:type II toxin-antitoxin system RelE/ParE family toxin n=1 Tax=Caulobacter radicis TaxID=2172650 RepID=UPI001FCBD4B9|nr:type II toxin-antitoxin system RelE/ParE family toxin [Caulobacter radicis]